MNDSHIHQVLVTRLEVAVQVSVAEHPHILVSAHIQVVLQNDLILCQRSGLVRT
ncbi:hypothetical protein SDC9_176169 [bioreactor metagenome]|uniref:Uncharacterized protein n=1 Tax=bioreactor metagenome TaxID=1076179 RepID=A0A645GXH2_9ZZZZ